MQQVPDFFLSLKFPRSQLIITKLEQKVNEQQVEIFKLKKKIKFSFVNQKYYNEN